MSIDIRQFHAVFFEESFEGLEIMESSLLSLDDGSGDEETINTIFRAAHSIKGGSGTFGFTAVAQFTHVMETLLDQMRAKTRPVTRDATDVLLQSVDCLRHILSATRDGVDLDAGRVVAMQQALEALLAGNHTHAAATAMSVPASADAGEREWRIAFHPHLHLLRTGNEPLRLLRELEQLGHLAVTADTGQVPALANLNPEDCYLTWEAVLAGHVDEAQIREVFAWVEDDCDLRIAAVEHAAATPAAAAPAAMAGPAAAQPGGAETRAAAGNDRRAGSNSESSSIRVSTDKVDAIINLVGELVITQSMLNTLGDQFEMGMLERLRDGFAQLERNTRELQETVLKIRMLPISFSFNRFLRLVHDLSTKLGKKVNLKLTGEHTELDKTVLEKINDPLVHLIRNSLDHGIENPEVRRAAGKPETGTIHLNAFHEGGSIVIEITDDGAGLNTDRILRKARERGLLGADETPTEERVHDLIFAAGFSTADQVSDVSGRGVGMDVVRRNIKELGGNIDIRSRRGEGTVFTIRLPLTLAILDGQLVKVGDQTYVVPLVSIVESLQVRRELMNSVVGKAEVYRLRDQYIPILRLYDVFRVPPVNTDLDKGLLVVVEAEGQKAGVFVDDLLGQQQVVIKSLETNFRRVDSISGATILGDGTVAMILDIPGLITLSRQHPDRGKSRCEWSGQAAA